MISVIPPYDFFLNFQWDRVIYKKMPWNVLWKRTLEKKQYNCCNILIVRKCFRHCLSSLLNVHKEDTPPQPYSNFQYQ